MKPLISVFAVFIAIGGIAYVVSYEYRREKALDARMAELAAQVTEVSQTAKEEAVAVSAASQRATEAAARAEIAAGARAQAEQQREQAQAGQAQAESAARHAQEQAELVARALTLD